MCLYYKLTFISHCKQCVALASVLYKTPSHYHDFNFKTKFWPPSLSELTPFLIPLGLTHLGTEASKYSI